MISDFGVLNMFVIEDCYFWEDKKLEICLSRNVLPKEPTFQCNEAHCSLQVIAIPYSEGDCRAASEQCSCQYP